MQPNHPILITHVSRMSQISIPITRTHPQPSPACKSFLSRGAPSQPYSTNCGRGLSSPTPPPLAAASWRADAARGREGDPGGGRSLFANHARAAESQWSRGFTSRFLLSAFFLAGKHRSLESVHLFPLLPCVPKSDGFSVCVAFFSHTETEMQFWNIFLRCP